MATGLNGKVAFITGIARGQGRSHAIRLAEERVKIIGLDICLPIQSTSKLYPAPTIEDLLSVQDAIEQSGGEILALQGDVRDYSAVAAAVQQGVERFGRLDVVVANAGIFPFGDKACATPEETWRETLDINVTGVWNTVRAAVPTMITGACGGSIVITSSSAGLKAAQNAAAYVTSKHAVVGLMRVLALELAEHQIRVNTIHPTGVATPMIKNDALFGLFVPGSPLPTEAEAGEVFKTTNALPIPWLEPSDVSDLVLFLASDGARFITGATLTVDAGYTIK